MRWRLPSELSVGERIAITVAIALAVLLALALFGYLSGRWDDANAQGGDPQLYDGVALDPALIEMDKVALSNAYHAQLQKLFGVWLASGAPREANEFSKGLRIARRAYHQAADAIAKREQQLKDQR